VSDTDFVGVTIYFYVDGKDEIYQASNCKPCMYFGRDPRQLLNQSISDYVTFSISEMAHGAFKLERAKVSRDGRLSLHKDLKVSKAPYLGIRAYRALAARSWVELVDRLRSGELHPVGGAEAALVLVEPEAYSKVAIDEKNARATAELADARGAKMLLEVPLRPENNFLVDNLEVILNPKNRLIPSALFGRAWLAEGRLKIFPYTAIYGGAAIDDTREERRGAVAAGVNELHLALEAAKKVFKLR
jgi:hypothetical protein